MQFAATVAKLHRFSNNLHFLEQVKLKLHLWGHRFRLLLLFFFNIVIYIQFAFDLISWKKN